MGNANNAADYHAIDHHTVFRGSPAGARTHPPFRDNAI
jgi:hypothetical protein